MPTPGAPARSRPQTSTQAPEKVRLFQGILYGDKAFISLEDVALFDGARTVRFKDGSERELPEGLAVALRARPQPVRPHHPPHPRIRKPHRTAPGNRRRENGER